ncbi:MAG: hypothetical protein ACI4RV_02100 [Eubacteriales bacterium]
MQINWKQKLTSRKFWAAVVTFVTAMLAAFGVSDITVGQVTAVITAAAAMIAYIIGEGFVDAARLQRSDVSDSADNSETVKK